MKTMAIAARRRVWVSCEDGFAMNAFCITIVGVAGRTLLDHSRLIPFPWGHLMDLFMTVLALHLIDEVGACIMLRPLLLMAPMAGHRLGMNPRPFCFHMGFDIRNIPVTTVARIGSMNRLSKFPLADLLVATQTFRVVDALITIFPTLDDELLAFL